MGSHCDFDFDRVGDDAALGHWLGKSGRVLSSQRRYVDLRCDNRAGTVANHRGAYDRGGAGGSVSRFYGAKIAAARAHVSRRDSDSSPEPAWLAPELTLKSRFATLMRSGTPYCTTRASVPALTNTNNASAG